MKKAIGVILLAALGGCAGYTVSLKSMSACQAGGEASYHCQVERYNAVGR